MASEKLSDIFLFRLSVISFVLLVISVLLTWRSMPSPIKRRYRRRQAQAEGSNSSSDSDGVEPRPHKTVISCLKNAITLDQFIGLVEHLDFAAISRIPKIAKRYFGPIFADGQTILHKLVVVNDPVAIEIVRLLVVRFKAPVNLISPDAEPLLNAAIRAATQDSFGDWQNEMIYTLIDLNCDVNIEAINGERPLLVAYKTGNLEAAVRLVMHGANPANVVAFEHRLLNKYVPTKLRNMIRDRFVDLNLLMYAEPLPTSVTVYPMVPGAKFNVRFTFDNDVASISEPNDIYLLQVQIIDFSKPGYYLGLCASDHEVVVESATAYGKKLYHFNPRNVNAFNISTALRHRPVTGGRGKRMFLAEIQLATDLPPGKHFMAAVMRYRNVFEW